MPLLNKLARLAENATAQYGEMTRVVNNTALSGTATLHVHIDNPKNLYTSGDIISGEVTLTLKREIDLSEITLKYKIDETTELIQVEDNRNKRQEQVSFKSAARVYEKSVRLFPSEQNLGQLEMRKLTLPPGTHTYPFSVRIPGHEKDDYKTLPPSFIDPQNKGTICHTLKVTLKRSSSFKQNSRYEVPLQYMPAANPKFLNRMQSFTRESHAEHGSLFNRKETVVKAAVTVPTAIQPSGHLPLQVRLESMDLTSFTVLDIVGELFGTATIAAQQRKEEHPVRHTLFQRTLNLSGSKHDLSQQLQNITLPDQLVPSFQTKFISMRYFVQVTVRVAIGSKNKVSAIQIGADIQVLGPHLLQISHAHDASTSYSQASPHYKPDTKTSQPAAATPAPQPQGASKTAAAPPSAETAPYYPPEKHDPNDLPPAYQQ